MNTLRTILSITWKELQVIARDRGWLVVLFLMPLLFSSAISGMNLMIAGGGDKPDILLNVALVNQDTGTFGKEIAKTIVGIQGLKVEILTSADVAKERVALGKTAAAILIPADFSGNIDNHTPTTIEVMVDPAEPESASIVTGIVKNVVAEVTIWGEVQYGIRTLLDQSGLLTNANPEEQRAIEGQSLGAVMTQLNVMRMNPAISVVSEDLTGAKIQGSWGMVFAYTFPAFTVMFIFFIVAMAATSLLSERETGTLRRLIASPIPRSAIIAGKTLAYMLVVCLQVVLVFMVGYYLFDMLLGQTILGLVLVTLVVALTATSLGMLIAAVAKTVKQADNLGIMLAMVMAGIGGALPFSYPPIFRASGFIGTLSQLTPQAHAINAYYSLMAENATITHVLPDLGILLAMSVAFFAIAVWRFKYN